jgi:dTDP-4-amino-4,6-dideoxygalactose transaminase
VSDRPAILGGVPVRAGKTWAPWPQSDGGERRRLEAVLGSGAWSSAEGEEVERFVAEFTEFLGAGHGIAVTNGTHALEAALAGCEVGAGDQVIVPALTFVATATSVMSVNATPVLVDVDPESFCIDPAAVEEAITDRTRAVIAVHLAGRACDMDALTRLCAERGLALIEDCAHSHGTRWRGRATGTLGAAGAFSFQQSKLITAGEGGMVTTDDAAIFDQAWSYANLGRVRDGAWHHHAVPGTNLRMTEWQGAVLRAQLGRLPSQHRIREERGDLLDAELARLPGLRSQPGDPRMDSRARYAYGIHYDPAAFSGLPRESLEEALSREGIPLSFRYPSLNELELFRESRYAPPGADKPKRYPPASLPHAEGAAANTVWLDHRLLLGEPEDVLDVVVALDRIRDHANAVRLRTGKAIRIAGRLARSILRRPNSSGIG